jgi:hypothetical protein
MKTKKVNTNIINIILYSFVIIAIVFFLAGGRAKLLPKGRWGLSAYARYRDVDMINGPSGPMYSREFEGYIVKLISIEFTFKL